VIAASIARVVKGGFMRLSETDFELAKAVRQERRQQSAGFRLTANRRLRPKRATRLHRAKNRLRSGLRSKSIVRRGRDRFVEENAATSKTKSTVRCNAHDTRQGLKRA